MVKPLQKFIYSSRVLQLICTITNLITTLTTPSLSKCEDHVSNVWAYLFAFQGDDLLSFLFRCPIGSLQEDEALQMEMLIKALKVLRPVMKVADSFVIGTRLTATVCNFSPRVIRKLPLYFFRWLGLLSPIYWWFCSFSYTSPPLELTTKLRILNYIDANRQLNENIVFVSKL